MTKLRQIVEKLSQKKEEKPRQENKTPEYTSLTITEDDELYNEHRNYLNEERDLEIGYGNPITHIHGENNHTIYAGPSADQLLHKKQRQQ